MNCEKCGAKMEKCGGEHDGKRYYYCPVCQRHVLRHGGLDGFLEGGKMMNIEKNVKMACKFCGAPVVAKIYHDCNAWWDNNKIVKPGIDIPCYRCDACGKGTGPSIRMG